MIRSLLIAATLGAYAGGAPAQDAWNELIGLETELAREMSRIDTVLAYQDLADRIAILQGQATAADADARLKALGAQLVKREVGESDLADARARLGAAIAGYLDAVGRLAASSDRWPGGAAQQASAQALLEAVRASYPRFLQANLDPTPLVMQVALVTGWAQGESAVANPFAGHLLRMQEAYPDARTRARIAAAHGPLLAPDGTPVAANPLTPPPPTAGERGGGQPTLPATTTGQLLGCFKDTSAFDLDGHLERSAANTPQACIARCASFGFRYAGVQYGESCLCGDSYGRYGPADNCNYACTGDAGQICGGYSANSIYATGAQGVPIYPPPPSGASDQIAGGLELDTDRPGMDLTSFDLEAADPVLCLTACQDYGGCVAFTYVKPGVQGPAARCWLKGGVPAAVSSSCCISGTP